MNIFISYGDEALCGELAQSLARAGSSGRQREWQRAVRAAGAQGWARENKAKFKQVKIN